MYVFCPVRSHNNKKSTVLSLYGSWLRMKPCSLATHCLGAVSTALGATEGDTRATNTV